MVGTVPFRPSQRGNWVAIEPPSATSLASIDGGRPYIFLFGGLTEGQPPRFLLVRSPSAGPSLWRQPDLRSGAGRIDVLGSGTLTSPDPEA